MEASTVKEDEFGAKDYRELMELKPDHASRPLWVVRLTSMDWFCPKHNSFPKVSQIPKHF